MHSVQPSAPTPILLFSPYDPSGAGHLPADAITCAACGAHAVSVLTALHVQDTTGILEIQDLAPEFINEQARALLEDISVRAIKVGPLYTLESVSVLAQIAADYSDLPLVLQLAALPDQGRFEDNDPEEVLAAIFELLLPQTDVIIVEHAMLEQWHTEGLISAAPGVPTPQVLIHHGADWVLTTASPMRPGHSAYVLHGGENAVFSWSAGPAPVRVAHTDGPLACAVAVNLARGLPMAQAVETGIKQTEPMLASSYQAGMGYRLINRSLSHQ